MTLRLAKAILKSLFSEDLLMNFNDAVIFANLLPSDMKPSEAWAIRQDLAACYRLVHHHGMGDLIYNHISAKSPHHTDQIFLNAWGLFFEDITTSNLVTVNLSGEIIDDPIGKGVSSGGLALHRAVYQCAEDIECVIHVHSVATAAVASMVQGLLPLSQQALRFFNRMAYHGYEGVDFFEHEVVRLQQALGERRVMLVHNNGALVTGRSIAEAFDLLMHLERACQIQMTLLASQHQIIMPTPEIAEQVARSYESSTTQDSDAMWPGLLRMMDRKDPSYRN